MDFAPEPRDKVFAAAEITSVTVSLVANGLVVALLYRNPSLRTVSNVYICSLALADILVSCFVPPISIIGYLGLPRHMQGCLFVSCLATVLTNNSVLTLLVVTLERWLAVNFPVRHRNVFTQRRVVISVGVAWVIGTLLGFIPLMGWHIAEADFKSCSFMAVIPLTYHVYVIFFGIHLSCLIFMLFVYTKMFWTFHEWHRKKSGAGFPSFRSEPEAKKRMIRRVSLCAILCTVFAVCWLPLDIANSLCVFDLIDAPSEELWMALVSLSHTSAAVHPFIYGFFSQSIREAAYNVLEKKGIQLRQYSLAGSVSFDPRLSIRSVRKQSQSAQGTSSSSKQHNIDFFIGNELIPNLSKTSIENETISDDKMEGKEDYNILDVSETNAENEIMKEDIFPSGNPVAEKEVMKDK